MLLKACLNGARRRAEHPRLPVTPAEVAADANAVAAAGAGAIHVHPRAADGHESLEGEAVDATVVAVRETAPTVPIGVTTGAWIESDPDRRVALIEGWRTLPDFASVNFSEDGAERAAETLLARGVAVEVGLWTADDVERLARSDLAARCLRVLLEPFDQEWDGALATVATFEDALDRAEIRLPRLLHGVGEMAWPLLRAARERGYDTRIGLEDVLVMPDGSSAPDNAALVAAGRKYGLAIP